MALALRMRMRKNREIAMMRCPSQLRLLVASALLPFLPSPSIAAEPAVTLENHVPPEANLASESLSKEFSYQRAVRFTDNAAMDWQESRSCVTCHTNGLYLVARPAAGLDSPAYREARSFARNYLKPHVLPPKKQKKKPLAIEGMVATTAFLAISDMKTNGKLGEVTKMAFEDIWTQQDESGAWEKWIKCQWGPYEVDNHFGVTLVALAVGMAAQDDYTSSPAAVAGTRKLRGYLKAHPPSSLHQTGMMLWASAHLEDLAGETAVKDWQKALFAAQKEDGGWVLAELGNADWKRADKKAQSKETDGYATAFAVHVLTESGRPGDDPRLAKARRWLRTHQRESGRWFTSSPHKDNKHFISHAATNFALLALSPDQQ